MRILKSPYSSSKPVSLSTYRPLSYIVTLQVPHLEYYYGLYEQSSGIMGGNSREGATSYIACVLLTTECLIGGKAKPLKAPKKQKQELDEDDVAFKEKQKAGMAMWLR